MTSQFHRVFLAVGVFTLCFGLSVGTASAQWDVPTGNSIDLLPPGGQMDLGCSALQVQGNFNLGSGQLASGGVTIGSGGKLDAGQGNISVSGNWSNSGTFVPGTGTVTFNAGCAPGNITLSGGTTFNNLTLSGTSGLTFVIPVGHNITVNGTLTLLGNGSQPISLISSAGQTAFISLGPQATVVRNNVNVNANVQIGELPPQSIPTLSEYGVMALALLMLLAARKRLPGGAFNVRTKR